MNVTIIPVSSIGMNDMELLDSCIWRRIKFYAKMTPHTSIVEGHVVYYCAYGYQKGRDIVMNTKGFRYSELLELYTHLIEKYKLEKVLPKFPPKHYWGNTYKSVIDARIKAFDSFFRILNVIMDINNDDKLQTFFKLDLSGKTGMEMKRPNVDKFIIED